MGLGATGHAFPTCLDPNRTVQVVERRHQQHRHQQESEEPVDDQRQERQLEHEEADVGAELWIIDSEGSPEAEQQPGAPLRGSTHPRHQGNPQGHDEEDQALAARDHRLVALQHLVLDAQRTDRRREPVGHGQVHPRDQEEDDRRNDRQADLGRQQRRPDRAQIEVVEPQVVGPEGGDGPQGERQTHQDDDRHDRGHPTSSSATFALGPPGHVGGNTHVGRLDLRSPAGDAPTGRLR